MKTFLIILAFSFSFTLYAQQKINFVNGNITEANIIEIGEKSIKYKLSAYIDGPLYIIDIKEVSSIVMEDGSVKKISSNIRSSDGYKKNMLSFHLLDLTFDDFTFSYERLFYNGYFGLQIPLGLGFQNQSYYTYDNKKNTIYSGIAAYYYPFGQQKWSYYLGPEFRFGYVESNYSEWYWDATIGEYEKQIEVKSYYTKMYVRNGVMFTPVESLSISANFGMGIQYYGVNEHFRNAAHAAINISYRF